MERVNFHHKKYNKYYGTEEWFDYGIVIIWLDSWDSNFSCL